MNRISVFFGWLVLCCPLMAWSSSVVIWPLMPKIKEGERAVGIRLQNTSGEQKILQVRVLAWDQQAGEDNFHPQQEIIVSPPFSKIAAGETQLVRLVRFDGQVADEQSELAFRVLIDEVTPAQPEDGQLLSFRMRYSLPLFVGKSQQPEELASQVSLACTQQGQQSYIQLHNHGLSHLRLSDVEVLSSDEQQLMNKEGLFGYILPQSRRKWPVAFSCEMVKGATLFARSYRQEITFPFVTD